MTGLDLCVSNLLAGINSALTGIGDSTIEGAFDTPVTDSVANAGIGWLGRLGTYIGDALDVNVDYVYMTQTATGIPFTPTGWSTTSTLRTSSREDAPTLTIYNGGVGGTTLSSTETNIATKHILDYGPTSDAIFVCTGFNDLLNGMAVATWLSGYQTLISNIQSLCPGVEVILTTQNQTLDTRHALQYAGMEAMAEYYTGADWPLSPTLIASSTENISVLDTWQAFNGRTLSEVLYTPGTNNLNVHPNGLGYQVMAQWMRAQLVAVSRVSGTGSWGWNGRAAVHADHHARVSGTWGWKFRFPVTKSSTIPWHLPFQIGGPRAKVAGTWGWNGTAAASTDHSAGATGTYGWKRKYKVDPSSTIPWHLPFKIGGPRTLAVGSWGWAGQVATSTDHGAGVAGTWGWRGRIWNIPPNPSTIPWTLPIRIGYVAEAHVVINGAWGWNGAVATTVDRHAEVTGTWGWIGAVESGMVRVGGVWGWTGQAVAHADHQIAVNGIWGWAGTVNKWEAWKLKTVLTPEVRVHRFGATFRRSTLRVPRPY